MRRVSYLSFVLRFLDHTQQINKKQARKRERERQRGWNREREGGEVIQIIIQNILHDDGTSGAINESTLRCLGLELKLKTKLKL